MVKLKPRTANMHAVVGSDESAVKRQAAELAQKLAPAEDGEFGLETIDGAADNVEQAAAAIRSTIDALQTIPLFGGGKLVWLKSANFLSDDVKGKSASVLEPLEDLGALINSGLAGDATTENPQSSPGQGSHGTLSPAATSCAVCLHLDCEPIAGISDGTFTTQKGWHDQQLCSRVGGNERSSIRDRSAGRSDASVPGCEFAIGYHSARPPTRAHRSRD